MAALTQQHRSPGNISDRSPTIHIRRHSRLRNRRHNRRSTGLLRRSRDCTAGLRHRASHSSCCQSFPDSRTCSVSADTSCLRSADAEGASDTGRSPGQAVPLPLHAPGRSHCCPRRNWPKRCKNTIERFRIMSAPYVIRRCLKMNIVLTSAGVPGAAGGTIAASERAVTAESTKGTITAIFPVG